MAPSRLEVGRVGRAHGLRGEVAVTFTSNRPERTAAGARLFAGDRELVIVAAREHQGRWLVQFEGVTIARRPSSSWARCSPARSPRTSARVTISGSTR